ncbi:MAG: hypothetical protein EBZ77_17090 [Chitinophagia bacterium]|nr:hypothetical protein [Chitinophagia bacterium]
MRKKNTPKKMSEQQNTYRVVLTLEVVHYVDAGSRAEAMKTAELNIETGCFNIVSNDASIIDDETKRVDAVFLDEGTFYTGNFCVLNVTDWTKKDWQRIEEAGDNGRLKLACEIDAEKKL